MDTRGSLSILTDKQWLWLLGSWQMDKQVECGWSWGGQNKAWLVRLSNYLRYLKNTPNSEQQSQTVKQLCSVTHHLLEQKKLMLPHFFCGVQNMFWRVMLPSGQQTCNRLHKTVKNASCHLSFYSHNIFFLESFTLRIIILKLLNDLPAQSLLRPWQHSG